MASGLVVLGVRQDLTWAVCNALSEEFQLDQVIIEEPISRREIVRRRVKKLGVRTVSGQLLFRALAVPVLRRRSAARIARIKKENRLDDTPFSRGPVEFVESANAPRTRELLARLAPRVVVVSGTRILSRETLSSTRARFINTHVGITPLYRGVHGGYWSLVQKQPEQCGVTVHLIDEGIDTGAIVGQARIEPSPEDNFLTYPYLQAAAAMPILKSAVRAALAGNLQTIAAPEGKSRLWTHPTLMEYLWHRVRSGVK